MQILQDSAPHGPVFVWRGPSRWWCQSKQADRQQARQTGAAVRDAPCAMCDLRSLWWSKLEAREPLELREARSSVFLRSRAPPPHWRDSPPPDELAPHRSSSTPKPQRRTAGRNLARTPRKTWARANRSSRQGVVASRHTNHWPRPCGASHSRSVGKQRATLRPVHADDARLAPPNGDLFESGRASASSATRCLLTRAAAPQRRPRAAPLASTSGSQWVGFGFRFRFRFRFGFGFGFGLAWSRSPSRPIRRPPPRRPARSGRPAMPRRPAARPPYIVRRATSWPGGPGPAAWPGPFQLVGHESRAARPLGARVRPPHTSRGGPLRPAARATSARPARPSRFLQARPSSSCSPASTKWTGRPASCWSAPRASCSPSRRPGGGRADPPPGPARLRLRRRHEPAGAEKPAGQLRLERRLSWA